jgi:hypothetical protein
MDDRMTDTTTELFGAEKQKCVRYSRDGGRVVESRDSDVVGLWEKFNRDFRPDSALFVNGQCRHQGAFTKDQCNKLESDLRGEPVNP